MHLGPFVFVLSLYFIVFYRLHCGGIEGGSFIILKICKKASGGSRFICLCFCISICILQTQLQKD